MFLPRLGLGLSLASLVLSAPVSAQQTDPERTAMARSLFYEGFELGQQGRWEEAADRYRRVLALRETPQVKYNLAHALSQIGEVVEPVELCRQILRDRRSPEAARSNARELLAQLEPRVGHLTIRLEGEPEGAEVRLDGAPVERVVIGVSAPVDPGAHEVVAVRDGETVASERIEVPEGGAAEVTLNVPPRPEGGAAEATPDVPPPEGGAAEATPDVPPPEPEPGVAPTPGETAAAGIGAEAGSDRRPAEEPSSSGGWVPWAAAGGAVLVAGAVVAALLLAGGDDEALEGNLVPGRIEF